MPARSETRDITGILTAVSAVNRPTLHDNIFRVNPGLSYLNGSLRDVLAMASKSPNAQKKIETGGESIKIALMYGKSKNTRSYEGIEPLTIKRSDKITNVLFPWKYFHDGAVISGADFRNNGGGRDVQKILDLAESETRIMELSLQEDLNEQFYLDGTGNNSKNMLGLAAMLSTTSVYGNLDPAVNTWWKAQVATSVGNWIAKGRSILRTQINNASKGSDRCDVIFTTQAIYEAQQDTLLAHMRIVNEKAVGLGFKNLMFEDEIPMFWDSEIPAGELYALNGKYIQWNVHADADFAMTPWKDRLESNDQDALTQHIITQANMTCSNRSRQVKLTGITT